MRSLTHGPPPADMPPTSQRPRPVRLRRPRPPWAKPAAILAGCGLGVILLAALAGWASQTIRLDQQLAAARQTLIDASAGLGLTLQEVLVTGRHRTDRLELLAAVGLQRGDTLLTFDIEEAHARIAALPWVKSVRIERAFPDAIRITLVERRALALWQNAGRLQVIDDEGEVIRVADIRRFRDLPILVGPDAAEQAKELLAMVAAQPELAGRVTAAVRVGSRRWDVRLDDRVDVRLPEDNPAAAWNSFVALQRQHKLLERDIVAVDLRLPDRFVIRLAPGAEERLRMPEKSTRLRPEDGASREAARQG